MKRSLARSVSLVMLALALASTGTGSLAALAATKTEPTVATQVKQPTPTTKDDSDVPPMPNAGEPGARITLSSRNDNTRDLGGYQTADGKWQIRPKRLIRSANLSSLTPDDIRILGQEYQVKKIDDFRTPGQVKNAKDKEIPGARWEQNSILGEVADAGVDSTGHSVGDGGFYNHQLEFSYSAVNGYHQFLTELLTNNQATLYHCSSGKDRTGIATVLIMSALGMDQATIERDFMLSQTYNHHVEKAWINEYYREINRYYGTMDNYMTKLLNFGPYDRELLRSKYLISTDGKATVYPTPVKPVTPNPTPTPAPQPAPVEPKPEKPAPQPETNGSADTATPAKRTVKVLSTKTVKKVRYVHTKPRRAYFYDHRLQYQVGLTKKGDRTKWRVLKETKLRVNGKKVTYLQVKSPHGYHRWIKASDVVTV